VSTIDRRGVYQDFATRRGAVFRFLFQAGVDTLTVEDVIAGIYVGNAWNPLLVEAVVGQADSFLITISSALTLTLPPVSEWTVSTVPAEPGAYGTLFIDDRRI
jgi:hypothetical protein